MVGGEQPGDQRSVAAALSGDRRIESPVIDADHRYLSVEGTTVQPPGGFPPSGQRLSWADLGFGNDTVEAGDSVEFEPDDTTPQIERKTVRVV